MSNSDTFMILTHILLLVMNLFTIILLYFNRLDRLHYQEDARREREYIIQVFSNAVQKMSRLIARVEERLNNGD